MFNCSLRVRHSRCSTPDSQCSVVVVPDAVLENPVGNHVLHNLSGPSRDLQGFRVEEVLHELSLNVEEGSIVSLLGRNGAGKSTVYKTIVGILHPRTGSVVYKGADISTIPPHKISRRGISLVPAERRIFPNLSVHENFKIAKEGQGGTDEEIEKVYEMFPDLRDVRDNQGQDLSGGSSR